MSNPASQSSAGGRPTAEAIAAWIVARLAAELHVDVGEVNIDVPLTQIGLDSIHALSLACDLTDWLGRELPADLIWKHPTVARLAKHLASCQTPSPSQSHLVAIQTGGRKLPLILVPPAATSPLVFTPLAEHLGPDQPVYGLEPLGLAEGEAPCERIEELAAAYVEAIEDRFGKGPYCLAGRCFGALVALEIGQQLVARGRQAPPLVIINTLVPPLPADAPPFTRAVCGVLRVMSKANYQSQRLYHLLVRKFREGHRQAPRMLPRQEVVVQASNRAREHYVPRRYPGRVTLVRAARHHWYHHLHQRLVWETLAGGGIECHIVPGSHRTLSHEPNLAVLARRLRSCLAGAGGARAATRGSLSGRPALGHFTKRVAPRNVRRPSIAISWVQERWD